MTTKESAHGQSSPLPKRKLSQGDLDEARRQGEIGAYRKIIALGIGAAIQAVVQGVRPPEPSKPCAPGCPGRLLGPSFHLDSCPNRVGEISRRQCSAGIEPGRACTCGKPPFDAWAFEDFSRQCTCVCVHWAWSHDDLHAGPRADGAVHHPRCPR